MPTSRKKVMTKAARAAAAKKRREMHELCDAAELAWDRAGSRPRKVTFTWRNRKYKSTMTMFRILVQRMNGTQVASRYHR